MRKSLQNKIKKFLDKNTIFYNTESPINIGDYWGYKYFICFHNTHTIYKAFDRQIDLEEFLIEGINKEIEIYY